MPIGIITNVLAVFLGGMLGGIIGNRIPERVKESLTLICGFSSLAIGIVLTMRVSTLGVVTLALIFGTIVGELLRLEDRVKNGFATLNRRMLRSSNPDDEYMSMFLAVLVLCCTSGTGIFGALNQGMTGDSSVLMAKAVLDFVTVLVFASTLGKFTSVICVPQAILFFLLFFLAKLIMPLLSDAAIGDFSAVGGVISLVTAFRIIKVKDMRIINILPAMILVFPISYLWGLIPF